MPLRVFALLGLVGTASCASTPSDDILEELAGLDYRMRLSESLSEDLNDYYARMSELVRPRVQRLSRVEDLKALLIACRLFDVPELPQERIQEVHPTYFGWSQVLLELETRSCDASARALVDAVADPRLGWDASSALAIGDAIVKRGSDCLPYLSALDPSYRPGFIRRMITKIESGSTSYLFD